MNAALPPTFIACLHGPDQPGLVARTAQWIFERGGNIRHADQHRDSESGIFFQRIVWVAEAPAAAETEAFSVFCSELGMTLRLARADESLPVAVFVSRQSHCLHDLLLRARTGELKGPFVCVVSNHPDLEEEVAPYGIPFHCIPVTATQKKEAEQKQLELLSGYGVKLVVMARYMQILSPDFLEAVRCPVINIHHSFLPAFAGARPYHQAHVRGVKIIGATAHYATRDLDEGPIIQQDVTPVTHRHSVADLIRKGRDMERMVLAQAVRWHLEHRILTFANKTVVFD